MNNPMIRSALLTVLTLFGGLAVGFLVGSALYGVLPGSTIENPLPMHITIAAFPALAGFLGGGAAWGVAMERIHQHPPHFYVCLCPLRFSHCGRQRVGNWPGIAG